MTDEQLKALLTELVAIRADVATKADLLKLEEGLTEIIVKLARSIHVEISAESTETLYTRVERLEANYYTSAKRIDLLTASREVQHGQIVILLERSERANGTAESLRETLNAWMEVKDAEIARLKGRVEYLGARIQTLEEERDINNLLARIQTLEALSAK